MGSRNKEMHAYICLWSFLFEQKGWWRHNFTHQCGNPIGSLDAIICVSYVCLVGQGIAGRIMPSEIQEKRKIRERFWSTHSSLLAESYFMNHVVCQNALLRSETSACPLFRVCRNVIIIILAELGEGEGEGGEKRECDLNAVGPNPTNSG